MANRTYFELQPSEAHLLAAASRIFAAHVAAGRVGEADEGAWILRSIQSALRLARTIEEAVQSDDEAEEGKQPTRR